MKKRIGIMASDSILLTFLGLVYAWSVFKKPLAAQYGWNDSQLTWTFTICMFMFCLGGFAGAELSKKLSHRILTWGCGILIGLAFFAMGFMTALWQLYVLYGVVIGFSVGIVYNCVLATGNRWFPDKGGLIAGLLLMFFGAGSLFLSPLSNSLILNFGLKTALTIIGAIFAVVFILGGFLVITPNEEESLELQNLQSKKAEVKAEVADFAPSEMMKTKAFWLYFFWCVLVSAIGIALLGQIATISGTVGLDSTKAALMVSLFAVFNGLGRLYFGGFYDKHGRALTMTIFGIGFTLGGLSLVLGLLKSSIVFVIISFVLFGIAYGGVTPTNANFARSFFGNANYATNFSLVNFNLLLAVFLGQFVGSTLYMKTEGFVASAIAITILSVISLCLQFLIKKPEKN